ncbi:thioredoxin family protein [Bacillus sp. AGMB 02131]|uniref:Thioredoxin family protein n=1 Tax=Peribacillus faecalis TaxID=2772559 RepID=A0A927CW37_9BACI|nr:thioredoxin family protein [Peribacillus faecalis]MBD3108229.1 thioredoxin family protein [Peribacillus faecalis]
MNEWNKQSVEEKLQAKDTFCLYVYTPLCGTCQVASKMLLITKEILKEVTFAKSDANYLKELAYELKIESVPCLLLIKNGVVIQKIYAFQSVPYLVETINSTLID